MTEWTRSQENLYGTLLEVTKLGKSDGGTQALVMPAWRSLWVRSRLTELWKAVTDSKREECIQACVVRVEIGEKEEGTCEVALLPQIPSLASDWLELTPKMGAGDSTSSIYPPEPLAFETVVFRFKAPKGGRNRIKVPRAEPQAQTTS